MEFHTTSAEARAGSMAVSWVETMIRSKGHFEGEFVEKKFSSLFKIFLLIYSQ